jgi:hypothetical protein
LQHASWVSFFLVTLMWFAIPGIIPAIKKTVCPNDDHPICQSCTADPKFRHEAGIDWELLAKDKTCQLCAPYGTGNFGCGGMGTTGLGAWYTGPAQGPLPPGFAGLLRMPANVSAKAVGMQPSDVIGSNLAGIAGSILVRYVIGPFCEHYGVRLALTALLLFASLPGFLICRKPRARSRGAEASLALAYHGHRATRTRCTAHPALHALAIVPRSLSRHARTGGGARRGWRRSHRARAPVHALA